MVSVKCPGRCKGSLSLCGAVHFKLPWQVLKTSLVPSGEGGEEGGWMEQRVVSMVGRKAHVMGGRGGYVVIKTQLYERCGIKTLKAALGWRLSSKSRPFN